MEPINDLLNQTCIIATQAGIDKFANLTFNTAISYPCRFTRTSKIIATVQNDREPIDAIVSLDSNVTINAKDKLTFAGIDYRVMALKEAINQDGSLHHLTAQVQRWKQ